MLNLLLTLSSLILLASSQQDFNNQYSPPNLPVNLQQSESGLVDVQSSFVDSTLIDIVWCGEKKNVIFYLTDKNSLYRSADDGFTGKKISDHLQKIGKEEIAGDSDDVGQVSRIMQSSVDKNLIVFLGTEGVNWITEDCGSSFRALNQGRRIDEFQLHPSQRDWILASAWTLCEDFAGGACKKYKELFISKDLGNTWELISNYVFQFSWGKFDNTFFTIPDQRIIVVHDIKGKGNQKSKGWNPKLQVSYSDDLFKTSVRVVERGNRFLLTSSFFFVVQTNAKSDAVNLLVSASRLTHYFMTPINLPVKRVLEHSYTILDTSEHSVFLHINHDGENSRYGNIYKSDSTGTRYATALKGNVRSEDGQCDFQRVQGIEGIYLANVYDQDALKKYKNTGSSNFPVQHPGAKRTSDIAFSDPVGYSPERGMKAALFKADSSKKTLNNYKKTMISFDKGSIWQPLSPPYKDRDGERIVCKTSSAEEFCSLHLHSISSINFGPFYTTENSVGLIIGTGNVGAYLSNRPDEINTYLSRDGGLTWFEIMKGSSIYEVGDHGSLIVLAPDQHATTEVYYSWNEGKTWQILKISDVPIEINNIITEPSNTAEKFLIYGRASDQTSRGVVIAADFTPVHQRWCQGQDKPDTPESDYETWTPNGKISPHCLLGRQVSYVRRKREAECFSNEQQENWKYVKSCECTEEDWECEAGYERFGSGPCLPLDEKATEESHKPPEECKGYYYISQGYRKIGGDSCFGGVDHNPIRVPCPGMGAVNSENLGVIVMLSVAVGMLIWLNNKGNTERAKGRLGMFYRNMKKRISRLRQRRNDKEFHSIDKLPETLRDEEEEDDFGAIVFEETEEIAEVFEDAKIVSSVSKRMTEGKALEAAQNRVPILHKPSTSANVICDYFVAVDQK